MSETDQTAYDFIFESLRGEPMPLADFKGLPASHRQHGVEMRFHAAIQGTGRDLAETCR